MLNNINKLYCQFLNIIKTNIAYFNDKAIDQSHSYI